MTEEEKDLQIGRIVREHGEVVTELERIKAESQRIGKLLNSLADQLISGNYDDLDFSSPAFMILNQQLDVADKQKLLSLIHQATDLKKRKEQLESQFKKITGRTLTL